VAQLYAVTRLPLPSAAWRSFTRSQATSDFRVSEFQLLSFVLENLESCRSAAIQEPGFIIDALAGSVILPLCGNLQIGLTLDALAGA
jgi:hypothetical protein